MSEEYKHGYESGYRDASAHYELEHCPACPNIVSLQESLEENTKLRELADLLLWGLDNDVSPAIGLFWSQKVNVLLKELGIEVPA